MSGNSFGTIFKVTTFGESHGVAMGAIIDGCPPNIEISEKDIQKELDKRKPGQSAYVTQRKESDDIEILSGVFEGKTTGTPIGLIVKNQDQRSKDYENIKDIYLLSNVFILSSKYEGLGLVLLEALSSKIPIIATNTSAIPEIIKNNYNGLLFNPGDYKSLASKLKKIEKNDLRIKIMKNGYDFIKKKFDLDKMNYLTNKIYRS